MLFLISECVAFSDTTWQPSYFGGIDRGTVVAVTNGTAPLSGNFRLSYAGRAWEDEAVTEPISVFATPGQVKAAVEALPTLGSNSVIVTRSKDKSPQAELAWSITFVPSAGASGDLPLLSVDKASSNIGGTDAEVYTSTLANGLSPLFGTFDLSLSKAQGAAAEAPLTIAHDAEPSAVRDAVLALPSLRDAGVSLDVTRDGPGAGGAYAWTLTFAAAAQTSGAGPGSSRGPLGAGAGGGAAVGRRSDDQPASG